MRRNLLTTRIKIVLSLLSILVLIIISMYWNMSNLHSNLIESSAVRTAEIYTASLRQARAIYTKYAVKRVKENGVAVVHNFKITKGSIPLPATFTIMLGESIGEELSGAISYFYSPYPFPWKKKNPLHNDQEFNEEAWKYLSDNQNDSYYRFSLENANQVLRYATADTMGKNCVTCHNTYPGSPKTDWKVGDMRGIIEVNIPLDDIITQTEQDLKKTLLYYIFIGSLLASIIGYVIFKSYKKRDTLENMVDIRTSQLDEKKEEFESIFKLSPNITVVTDKNSMIKANQQFFEFTNYKNLDHFKEDYNCICDMFEKRDGYLESLMEEMSWSDYILAHNNVTHKAIIKKDDIEHIFTVKSSEYKAGKDIKNIVIFEDITRLEKLASTDPLTNLYNRISIDEKLSTCLANYNKLGHSFSVILIDLDYFKQVNDAFGHLIGDSVLCDVAGILKQNVRAIDLVGRWGGEEFLIVCTETNEGGVYALAQKLREKIQTYAFQTQQEQTASFGVGTYEAGMSLDEFIHKVDEALYKSKEEGRNQVTLAI